MLLQYLQNTYDKFSSCIYLLCYNILHCLIDTILVSSVVALDCNPTEFCLFDVT